MRRQQRGLGCTRNLRRRHALTPVFIPAHSEDSERTARQQKHDQIQREFPRRHFLRDDRLEKEGQWFLSRSRSEADRRVIELSLTECGRNAAVRLPQIGASVLNETL